jgi:hypothetical protein
MLIFLNSLDAKTLVSYHEIFSQFLEKNEESRVEFTSVTSRCS